MNKRANLYLNILEFLFLGLSLVFMNLYLSYTHINFYFRNSFFLMAAITGLIFISIECFLFLLMKTKIKIAYIGLLLVDILLAVVFNLLFPFSCPLVFLLFCLMKNFFRILLVNKIYIPREFNYYCRMFGITIKYFKKKKVVKKVENQQRVQKKQLNKLFFLWIYDILIIGVWIWITRKENLAIS